MFRALQRWWSKGPSRERAQLMVEGEIVESGTHQPLTHLGPNPAPEEAYFALKLSGARRSDGSPERIERIVPAEFSGPLELLKRFSVGDRVCITATTATGRQIETIEALPASPEA